FHGSTSELPRWLASLIAGFAPPPRRRGRHAHYQGTAVIPQWLSAVECDVVAAVKNPTNNGDGLHLRQWRAEAVLYAASHRDVFESGRAHGYPAPRRRYNPWRGRVNSVPCSQFFMASLIAAFVWIRDPVSSNAQHVYLSASSCGANVMQKI